ncbi:hypothetical protein CHUAL_000730 [Chamberlinius hualienensis]
MEWSSDRIYQLIEMYKEHRMLWDPKDPSYRFANKRQEIWESIGQELGANTNEVQRKMNSLLASYRRERKLETSKWFAFDKFDFLHSIYYVKSSSINSESDHQGNSSLDVMVAKDEAEIVRKQPTSTKSRKRSAEIDKRMENRRKKDDLDLFGEYITSEIRKLNKRTQMNVKHLINNIIFEAQMSSCDDADQMIVMTSHHV